jgi:hypothetical protein
MFRAALTVLIAWASGVAVAQTPKAPDVPAVAQQPRQHYSKFWAKNKGYYFKRYFYKPAASSVTYRMHYLIYYASKPRYYFFFDPYKRLYWGRYDRQAGGYSGLPAADQRSEVSQIKEAAFQPPAAMPPIPESKDSVPIAGPPTDLPPDESEAVSVEKMKEILGKPTKDPPPRQAYSGWCKEGGYYFSTYYFQTKAGGEYKSHRVIYYRPKGQYLFYYDPYSKKYTGRYDLEAKGYSLLVTKDQGPRLARIPESAFPKPGEMPRVPGAEDDVKVAQPPTELPE